MRVQERTISLDVLRAAAVFLVFGAHMMPAPPELNRVISFLTYTWHRGGYVGVNIFFVMSGFLVSGLLFREYQKRGDADVRRFLARRALKLYPPLWALTAAGAYMYAPVTQAQVWGELLFLQNYLDSIWLHTWSLAVEEHFYLLLGGLAAWWLARRRGGENPFRHVPTLYALAAAAVLVVRVWLGLAFPNDSYLRDFGTHARLDTLMLGTFIAYLWHFKGLAEAHWWRQRRGALLVAGVLLLLPAFIVSQGRGGVWFYLLKKPLFDAGCAALLLGVLGYAPRNGLARGVAAIGRYSYSIYLWHLPVEIVTRTILTRYGWIVGTGPVQSAHIAARQQIPENYLSQMLLIMRNSGLIRSIRGPQGGHLLARDAAEINLGEVLTALEGPFLPMECVNPDFTDCSMMEMCVIRDVWRDLKAATDDVLTSTTLADLLQNRANRETEAMYYI